MPGLRNDGEPSGTGFTDILIDFNQMSAFSQCSDEKLSIKFSIDDNRNAQGAGAVRQGRGFVASFHVTCVMKPPFAPHARAFCGLRCLTVAHHEDILRHERKSGAGDRHVGQNAEMEGTETQNHNRHSERPLSLRPQPAL